MIGGAYEKSKNYDDGCFNCSAPKYRRVYRETERRYEARENEIFLHTTKDLKEEKEAIKKEQLDYLKEHEQKVID